MEIERQHSRTDKWLVAAMGKLRLSITAAFYILHLYTNESVDV